MGTSSSSDSKSIPVELFAIGCWSSWTGVAFERLRFAPDLVFDMLRRKTGFWMQTVKDDQGCMQRRVRKSNFESVGLVMR